MDKRTFESLIAAIQGDIQTAVATLKDKGLRHFSRAALVAMALPLAAHVLVYAPAKRRLSQFDNEFRLARNTAEHADAYKGLKDRLLAVYALLPPAQVRSSYLADSIKEALRAESIVASQFNPPVEEAVDGAVIQSIVITMSARFPEAMAFVSRMERSKPLIYVHSLEITKKADMPGFNDVTCGLSTVFPTERFQ